MSDLRADISAACADLDAVTGTLASIGAKRTFSSDSYDFFDRLRAYSAQLAESRNLIDARDAALAAVNSFPSQVNPDNPATLLYNGIAVPFWQGRLLLMQSYMGTCWAIYDNLSKVAGILICTDKSARNPTKPVKLQEDLLRLENSVGAHIQDHLKGGYGWPIGVSYAVRNWVIHDGNSQDGIELFRYSTHETAPYQLSDEAWTKIVERCNNKYKVDDTHTRLILFPDVRNNLAAGIAACNAEVDEAIGFVLLAATGGVKLHAQILFRRDS
jgi:hypothetical protein